MALGSRRTDYPIAPLFLERWSPRSFTAETIPDDVLMTLFEAARWTPSAYNYQPWRFIYAKREHSQWDVFIDLLSDVNRIWAREASALIYVLSDSVVTRPGHETKASYTHIFDAGAAWANLSVQATLLGWHTHCMQGFDAARASVDLRIPNNFRVNAAVAIGKRGPPENLTEVLRAREHPSDRRPISETVFAGRYPET